MTCHKILCLALVGRDRRAAVAVVEVGNAAASAPALPHPAWCFSVSNRERPSTRRGGGGAPTPQAGFSLISHPLLLPRRSASGHPPDRVLHLRVCPCTSGADPGPPATGPRGRREPPPQAPHAPGHAPGRAPHDDGTPRALGRSPPRRGPAGWARPPAARAAGRGGGGLTVRPVPSTITSYSSFMAGDGDDRGPGKAQGAGTLGASGYTATLESRGKRSSRCRGPTGTGSQGGSRNGAGEEGGWPPPQTGREERGREGREDGEGRERRAATRASAAGAGLRDGARRAVDHTLPALSLAAFPSPDQPSSSLASRERRAGRPSGGSGSPPGPLPPWLGAEEVAERGPLRACCGVGGARPWPESGGQLRYSHCGVGAEARPGPRDLPPPLDFEPVAATCAGACGAGICWGRGRPPRAPHCGPRTRRVSSSGLVPAAARALCRPRPGVPARPRLLLSLAACFVFPPIRPPFF